MRRSVGGVLARHLEGRRPVFAPSPVEEMEDVPISEQKDGEDESERIEEGEKNPASDKVVGNDLESINNEKHSKNQTNIRSRNDELALNNKTSIELDEPLLPEGQQAAAATTTAKKVGAALKVVSIEAESGAWHQLDGPVIMKFDTQSNPALTAHPPPPMHIFFPELYFPINKSNCIIYKGYCLRF